MTDKAYIVANKQQEREVLEQLEREGITWNNGKKPTEWLPSDTGNIGKATFPYVLINRGVIRWSSLNAFNHDATVIYDGRKEEQMSKKYVVSQEFMNELEDWKDTLESSDDEYEHFVGIDKLKILPDVVFDWRYIGNLKERNNRLIAILRWVNGEDVFEVDNPQKWVVRSKEKDGDGDYGYVRVGYHNTTLIGFSFDNATRFDTKEEAQSWANAHQEVVEVEE